jgi:hypothetical protein
VEESIPASDPSRASLALEAGGEAEVHAAELPAAHDSGPTRLPEPGETVPPEEQLSRAHLDAMAKVREFVQRLDVCCRAMSPEGQVTREMFDPRGGLSAKAEDEQSRLLPKMSGEELAAWVRDWLMEACDCCIAVGAWLDMHRDVGPATLAEHSFQALLVLAEIDEILPRTNDEWALAEHRKLGTLALSDSADKPGRIARVRTRGYRCGERVLRKADVLLFDAPSARGRSRRLSPAVVILCLFIGFGLTVLYFLWKGNPSQQRTTQPPGKGSEHAEVVAGSQSASGPIRKSEVRSEPKATLPGPPQPVRIDRFTVEPSDVSTGDPVVLTWFVANAKTVRITPELGSVDFSGSKQLVPPAGTDMFVLEADGEGAGNSVTAQRAIHIASPAPPVVELGGDQEQITVGQSIVLHWSVKNANSIRIDPGFGKLPSSGELTATPARTTEYTLVAENAIGTTSKTFKVRVSPRIVVFEAVPNSVEQCKIAMLRWTVYGATAVSIQPGIGSVNASSGYKVVRPLQSTRYLLQADSSDGSASQSVTVSVTHITGSGCSQ